MSRRITTIWPLFYTYWLINWLHILNNSVNHRQISNRLLAFMKQSHCTFWIPVPHRKHVWQHGDFTLAWPFGGAGSGFVISVDSIQAGVRCDPPVTLICVSVSSSCLPLACQPFLNLICPLDNGWSLGCRAEVKPRGNLISSQNTDGFTACLVCEVQCCHTDPTRKARWTGQEE